MDENKENDLPCILWNGRAVPVDALTQTELRALIPKIIRYSTGRLRPYWGKEKFRPSWWPKDIPYRNIRVDCRTIKEKRTIPWNNILRQIVTNFYKHHGREDLLRVGPEAVDLLPSQRTEPMVQHQIKVIEMETESAIEWPEPCSVEVIEKDKVGNCVDTKSLQLLPLFANSGCPVGCTDDNTGKDIYYYFTSTSNCSQDKKFYKIILNSDNFCKDDRFTVRNENNVLYEVNVTYYTGKAKSPSKILSLLEK